MNWFENQKHKLPQFQARYQGNKAVFGLDGSLIEGIFGSRAETLVKEWAV